MKALNHLIIAALSIFLVSCTISSEDQIEGTWDLKLETSYYGNTETDYGTMQFNQDGSGYLSLINNTGGLTTTTSSSYFTWEYGEYDQLIIYENGETIYLDNSVNSYNHQKFYHTQSNNGINITMTFTLTK